MTTASDLSPTRTWGFWAVMTGGLAMILVFIQIVGPMLETSPSAASQIGEMAGEMKRAAWRALTGQGPEEAQPQSVPWTVSAALAAPILGVIAVVLALISGILRENWRYAAYATGLGGGAILFSVLWWMVLVVLTVMLLTAIIENLGDFF